MDIWILIITELIWLTMTPVDDVAAAIPKCESGKEKNSLDCSHKGPAANKPTITEFSKSTNFNQTVSLDISDNKFGSAAGPHLGKFTNLIRFSAKGIKFETDGAVIPFIVAISSFKKLEELDLTATKFSDSPINLKEEFKITWALTLRRVSLHGMNLKNVSFSTLSELEELDLSLNKLTTLPRLHKKAPVVIINLSDNPLDNITVEQVSPYCLMTTFLLQGSKGGTLETNYLVCAPLEQWLAKYRITYGSLTCIKPAGKDYLKSFNFSEQALKDRQQCEASQSNTSFFELLLMAIFFSILFPVLYFANEAYQRYQSGKLTSASAASAKRHKRKDKAHAPSEIDYDNDYGDSEENEV